MEGKRCGTLNALSNRTVAALLDLFFVLWSMKYEKKKHFRRADVFISLGIPSNQKYGIFSANLRKFYCLVYKNEGICLMIDRSLCGLGGLCGAGVGGGMVMTACMPSRHFYFVLLLF